MSQKVIFRLLFAHSALVLPWVNGFEAVAEDLSPGGSLTPIRAENHARVVELLKRFPAPMHRGVDLAWHMDRTLQYLNHSLDRRDDAAVQGMPLYGNYLWPQRLTHSAWDAPHCTGRLLHAMTIWEATFNRRAADEQTIALLRPRPSCALPRCCGKPVFAHRRVCRPGRP